MWPKILNIHLKQLSITNNILDRENSTIINQISPPAGVFGESFTINYEKPPYKDLIAGFITELDFEVTTTGFISANVLNNHDQPISVELEIIN